MVLRAHRTSVSPLTSTVPARRVSRSSDGAPVSPPRDAAGAAPSRLCDGGRCHVLAPHEVFFRQGDAATSVCWVLDGRLLLSVASEDGREAIVGVAGAGAVLDESAMIRAGAPHTSTAIALEPATVLQVDVAVVARLSREWPDVGAFVLQSLLVRVADLQTRLAGQMMAGSEERLVHVLLHLASAADAPGGGARIPRLSQEVLARIVGTTRSRVNRLLRGLRPHGVRSGASGICIEREALRRWHRPTHRVSPSAGRVHTARARVSA